MDLEHEMDDCTGSNLNHRNSKKHFKETFVSYTRKTVSSFIIKDSYTGISHIIWTVLQPET